MNTITKALTIGLALAVGSGGAVAATAATPDSGDDGTAQVLSFSREEERMSRDLYQLFADTYNQAAPFVNVTKAEQRHFDAVGRLLANHGITDPAAGATAGTYADPVLQKLYDDWKAKGLTSLNDAYQVGIELEKRDIADLEEFLAKTSQSDVTAVLGRLLAGSKNHLEAFTKASNGILPGGPGSGQGPQGRQGRQQGSHGRGQGNGPGATDCPRRTS